MFQGSSRDNEGLTLLEIMISMVFFGIIAISLSNVLMSSSLLTSKDQNIIDANNMAKTYLNDTKLAWKLQADFDEGTTVMPDHTLGKYTGNDKYTNNVTVSDLATNDNNIVILRRVKLQYYKDGNKLIDVFLDFNRPGSAVQQ